MEKGEKREKVIEHLRREIDSGRWPEKRLPREIDLAAELGVARGTLRKALSRLEAEGLLIRKKHSGTMVSSEDPKPVIGAVMRCRSDFYEDVYRHLLRELGKAGYNGTFVDTFGYDVPKMRTHIRRGIDGILNSRIAGLISDGFFFYKLPRREEILRRNPVFFDFYDGFSVCPPNTTGVLIDYYQVGRMGAEYLLKKGCRHPWFFCGPLRPGIRYSPSAFPLHKNKRMIDGISDVLTAAGMDPWVHICMTDMQWKYIDLMLFEVFSDPGSRPDGLFCCEDVKVVKLLKIAKECGYVPHHRIGVYNTPWSRGRSGHYFPSIGLAPKKCAEALVRLVRLPPEQRENVYIQPELIERKTNLKYEI